MARRGPLGIGIVGCGGAAVAVAGAIARLDTASLVAVHDLDVRLAADLGAPSGARVHETLPELLSDPAVDLVYLGLPHDLLAPVAGLALAAGRSVLVEKPMGINVESIRGLAEQAGRLNLTLAVMFELRYASAAIIARRLVQAGALGPLTLIRIETLIDKPATYWQSGLLGRATSPWRAQRERAGGGVVLMNSIHQIDLVHSVTGLHVRRVSAETATSSAGIDVEDGAAIAIRWSNGAIGTIVAAAHSPGAQAAERIVIEGLNGSLRIPDLYGSEAVSVFLRRPWRRLPAGHWREVAGPSSDPFVEAIEAVVRSVVRRTAPPVGAREALEALAVVVAIYRSARLGRAVSPAPTGLPSWPAEASGPLERMSATSGGVER